jgi:hypothetical protein
MMVVMIMSSGLRITPKPVLARQVPWLGVKITPSQADSARICELEPEVFSDLKSPAVASFYSYFKFLLRTEFPVISEISSTPRCAAWARAVSPQGSGERSVRSTRTAPVLMHACCKLCNKQASAMCERVESIKRWLSAC